MSERSDADRCAFASLERDEPLLGTASRVRRWLILEQPGPWGREALVESRLETEIGHTLRSLGRRLGVRVLLVRRPGWRKPGATQRVYLAHTGRRDRWIEQLDVEHPRQLLEIDVTRILSDEAPGLGRPGPAAVHLVCTNGRHDPCCADLGRPVARALDDAGTPEVWESTHLGGDRFAANVACLPSGVYYGRVDPETAAAVLDDHARGLIRLEHYRGRSCFPPLVQTAEIFARRELDERRIEGLRVVATDPGDGELTVRFEDLEGRTVRAVVARERAERAVLTCHADGHGRPWRYLLRDLEVG
jgi:hypothetical protein